jgi:hypothetical protein
MENFRLHTKQFQHFSKNMAIPAKKSTPRRPRWRKVSRQMEWKKEARFRVPVTTGGHQVRLKGTWVPVSEQKHR